MTARSPTFQAHLPQLLQQHRRLRRVQDLHLSREAALHRIRDRNLVDEKEMHCSIRLFQSECFDYACYLRGCGISMVSGALPAFVRPDRPVSERTLSFAERVAYQRAIEKVYWRHRIWPPQSRGAVRPRPNPAGRRSFRIVQANLVV